MLYWDHVLQAGESATSTSFKAPRRVSRDAKADMAEKKALPPEVVDPAANYAQMGLRAVFGALSVETLYEPVLALGGRRIQQDRQSKAVARRVKRRKPARLGSNMTVNVGLIGASVMGRQLPRVFFNKIADARLAGTADAGLAKAAAVAAETGASRVFQNATELIASTESHVVVVASSDLTHCGLVLECIRHGKPVLCEKPLALTTEGRRLVVNAEISTGRHLLG